MQHCIEQKTGNIRFISSINRHVWYILHSQRNLILPITGQLHIICLRTLKRNAPRTTVNTTRATCIHYPHSNHSLSFLNQFFRNFITSRSHPSFCMPHLHTIKVSKIIVINYSHIQRQLFISPVSRNIYRFSKPNNTIKACQSLFLHQTGHFHCFPRAILQIGSRPYSFTIYKSFIYLLNILFPVFYIRMKFLFTFFLGYRKPIQHL